MLNATQIVVTPLNILGKQNVESLAKAGNTGYLHHGGDSNLSENFQVCANMIYCTQRSGARFFISVAMSSIQKVSSSFAEALPMLNCYPSREARCLIFSEYFFVVVDAHANAQSFEFA